MEIHRNLSPKLADMTDIWYHISRTTMSIIMNNIPWTSVTLTARLWENGNCIIAFLCKYKTLQLWLLDTTFRTYLWNFSILSLLKVLWIGIWSCYDKLILWVHICSFVKMLLIDWETFIHQIDRFIQTFWPMSNNRHR